MSIEEETRDERHAHPEEFPALSDRAEKLLGLLRMYSDHRGRCTHTRVELGRLMESRATGVPRVVSAAIGELRAQGYVKWERTLKGREYLQLLD
ncbi:hypothetical protein [Nocardioides sp. HB32]